MPHYTAFRSPDVQNVKKEKKTHQQLSVVRSIFSNNDGSGLKKRGSLASCNNSMPESPDCRSTPIISRLTQHILQYYA
jgi:hypothetical protein